MAYPLRISPHGICPFVGYVGYASHVVSVQDGQHAWQEGKPLAAPPHAAQRDNETGNRRRGDPAEPKREGRIYGT